MRKEQPGQRDAVRALWESHLGDRAAANPSLETYVYCYDNDDPDVIHLFEIYRDAAAQAADGGSAAFAAFMAEAGPLLEGAPEIHRTTPMWIKSA
ncbi:MAG: antibiotic biosynthesis monooxygenase [Alphaproteobacteria bacterium]